jgi:phosphate uptake regulator
MAGTDDATEPAARKVQRTGGSTFTVSLPKEWAVEQGLAAGSTVYLYPFEDRVVVAPAERRTGDRRVELAVAGLDPDAVARDVRRAYAAGVDTIAVDWGDDGCSNGRRSAAADALTGLVGMQIVEEGPAGLEARCTLDASAVSLDQTIAQLRQQTLSGLREAVRALVAGGGEPARAAERRVAEVGRLVALVERQFQGALVDVREVDQLDGDRSTAYRQVTVAHALADAADAAESIAAVATAQADAPAPALEAEFIEAGDAVRGAIRTALDDDRRPATQAIGEAFERIDAVDDALAETASRDAHRYGRALAALSRATQAARELAATGVDAADR